jgi:hypothetical protein
MGQCPKKLGADDSVARKAVEVVITSPLCVFTSVCETLSYRKIADKEEHERQRYPNYSMQALRGGQ